MKTFRILLNDIYWGIMVGNVEEGYIKAKTEASAIKKFKEANPEFKDAVVTAEEWSDAKEIEYLKENLRQRDTLEEKLKKNLEEMQEYQNKLLLDREKAEKKIEELKLHINVMQARNDNLADSVTELENQERRLQVELEDLRDHNEHLMKECRIIEDFKKLLVDS